MTIREVLDEYIASDDELTQAQVVVERHKTEASSTTQIWLYIQEVSHVEACKAQAAAAKVLRSTLMPNQLDSEANMALFVDFMTSIHFLRSLTKNH